MTTMMKRRRALTVAAGLAGALCWRTAEATADELAAAVRTFAAGGAVTAGRVTFEIAPLVENGNVVPISVSVQSPMTEADHVQAIAVFNERNPQRDVAVFQLGPRAGRAKVSTRIRLATSQQLVAVAKMSDGSCWTQTVDVLVTLAACVEP
ncbi:MAG TPA: SoxY-related AACIE arm protein [Burkholderiaceae bacterium]|jgi:sulfur-oxidizing protein SoxY